MKRCLLLVLGWLTFSAARSQGFSSAEYYYDTDPGIGNANPIYLNINLLPTINFNVSISASGLSNGIHILNIRAKSLSNWSQVESRLVYVSTQTGNVSSIVAAEYFFDNDPGVGNGKVLSSFTEGTNIVLSGNISSVNLMPGTHSLIIRVRNSSGQWSLFEQRLLYISTSTNKMAALSGAEYFIDLDPGVGKAASLMINNHSDTVNQNFICNVPSGTAGGQHFLWIRVKDENGFWSLVERDTIMVTAGLPLPLTWLSFSGSIKNDHTQLEWITEKENNLSYFEMERSGNGIQFEKIGKVNASISSINTKNYKFDDINPSSGINYYRLKEIDLDTKFTYSEIIKIYFIRGESSVLKLFPNPVENGLNIAFSGKEKFVSIHIFDANGKFVAEYLKENNGIINLNLATLAKGIYYIRLSDGVVIETGRFIK